MSEYIIASNDYLEHHGILGQKWGSKQGPPYPLDAEDHSAAEKKAGYRKSMGSVKDAKADYKQAKSETVSSAKKTLYKTAANIYNLNEKTYNKLGNKTLASMNEAAKNQMQKKLDAANEADAKVEDAKNTYKTAKAFKKYSNKVANKIDTSQKNAKEDEEIAKDIKKNGFNSEHMKYNRIAEQNHQKYGTKDLNGNLLSDKSYWEYLANATDSGTKWGKAMLNEEANNYVAKAQEQSKKAEKWAATQRTFMSSTYYSPDEVKSAYKNAKIRNS